MKVLRYFLILICVPFFAHAATHVVNQTFFLNPKLDKTWTAKDTIIVLGSEKIDINQVARARKNFPKSTPIYWLLSDDQWQYNNLNLNRDQKALDFANQLQEIYIQVLPENLCPKPAILHEKNFDILVIDSSWFLFQHQPDLFKQQCSSVDIDKFYGEIEESILNAKLRPVVIISHHGVHPKLIHGTSKDSLANFANQLHESLGSMDTISNPAYQKYQEKMNYLMTIRPNLMFVSANTTNFFRESNMSMHHLALPEKKSDQLLFENNKRGVKVTSKNFSDPILVEFNQSYISESSACEEFTGSMYDFKLRGSFYEFFLGSNYRKLWNKNISMRCFDLEREKLTVDRIGGSLRSPDFQLKDTQGRLFTLRPLKKEIHIPSILKDTLVEYVLQDQQSSIFPLGFLLSSSLAKQAGILSENGKLVYVDSDQAAFASWRDRKFPSGFYQLLEQPINLLKDNELKRKGVIEILNTKDMVSRLENESGYRMDQQNYLKARLFDMLIGDWDRGKDQWQWIVVQRPDGKMIVPFPVDREASFYHSNGSVSWWRRRKWINYKLQDYQRKLKDPVALMVQSYSMDHRYTSSLTQKDWDIVVADLQQRLSPQSMDKAINNLPIVLSREERKLLTESFQRRLKELPRIAAEMRENLRKSVDIVGTPGKDSFSIQAGPNNTVQVTQMKNNNVVFTDQYDTDQTKEIRVYGLDEDDDFRLNWQNSSKTTIRLIPGNGKDLIYAHEGKRKPQITLFDDNFRVDSFYGFIPQNYNTVYNDFYSQVNQRKLNVLAPVLFRASSNADSGFIIGGGLKYYKEGFQHSPWESTNEFKANVVLNRNAANIMYVGTKYDIHKSWDFVTTIDAGLPRFYGSFFGLGNQPPDLDPTKPTEYYWMRAQHLEAETKITMPIFQNVSLTPRLLFRFRDYKMDANSFLRNATENQLDVKLKPGTVADIAKANYYIGGGAALEYAVDDSISGPLKKRTVRAGVRYTYQEGVAKRDNSFQSIDSTAGLTGYFIKSKTQWKINGGYAINFGKWEFFDAQFLGQGQNLRGFFMNRFAGSGRGYGSFELNQSLLFRHWSVITDFGLGGFYDTGRVFLDGDTSKRWHKAVGGQGWITILNSFAFKTSYAHALFEDEKGLWSFTLTTEL